jgi:hypothetical protein
MGRGPFAAPTKDATNPGGGSEPLPKSSLAGLHKSYIKTRQASKVNLTGITLNEQYGKFI